MANAEALVAWSAAQGEPYTPESAAVDAEALGNRADPNAFVLALITRKPKAPTIDLTADAPSDAKPKQVSPAEPARPEAPPPEPTPPPAEQPPTPSPPALTGYVEPSAYERAKAQRKAEAERRDAQLQRELEQRSRLN